MTKLKAPPKRVTSIPARLNVARRQGPGKDATASAPRPGLYRNKSTLDGLYSTKRWRALRLVILERQGWLCKQTGVLLVDGRDKPNAAVIDHIQAHRGDLALFWDEDNLQAVAKSWHDKVKQKAEGQDWWRKGGWV